MADRKNPDAKPAAPNGVTLLGIGATFGVCVGIGAGLGILADHAAGTSPLLVLVGVFVGIVVGALGAYQVISPYVKSTERSTNLGTDHHPD